MNIALSAHAEIPSPSPTYSNEIDAVKKTLQSLLSPLHPDYQKELKIKIVLTQLPSVEDHRPPKKNPCYATPSEMKRFLFNEKSFIKKFHFAADCDLDGNISFSSEVFSVDLALKNQSPYYRIKFLLKMERIFAKQPPIMKVKAKILDGELYEANNQYEPYMKFMGEYNLIIDKKTQILENPGGDIFIESVKHTKVNQIRPLIIAN